MKEIIVVLSTLILASFLFASCQKAKEPENQKETRIQQTQKEEAKQQPSEQKPGDQAKEETYNDMKDSPVTPAEQKKVEAKFKGEIFREDFKNDKEIIEYLQILMKGNHRSFYLKTPDKPGAREGEPLSRFQYGDVIRILLSYLKIKDAFPFAVEILKTKKDYPEAMAMAAKAVKFAQDKSVIPLLREVAKHPDPTVRLEAAGSLLVLGDADTALPVLDALAEEEGSVGALYYVKRQLFFPVDDNYNSLNDNKKNQLTSFNLRFCAVLMR
ncbi:MAG: HEAT repeat domain-containing protein [Nitrospirota bacterium]